MKKSIAVLVAIMALALFPTARAQSPATELNHFAKNGLSFDYPTEVTLQDKSTQSGQHLVCQVKGQAQIMVMSRFDQITSAEALALARREVADSFAETMWQ